VIASTSHYFSAAPPVASRGRAVEFRDRGRAFRFHTAAGVFSRRGVDRGSRLLLQTVDPSGVQRVLDLGCGYGVLGIVTAARAPQARVVLVDVNPRAVALAKENVTLNRIGNADVRCGDGCAATAGEAFDLVLFNPPIRAGREVVLRLLREAHGCLARNGRLYLVARTQQGARTLGRLMGTIFASVAEVGRGGGFRVFEARRV
jgi:16S rRNA (guanine1207-N2)-methyltransferase